MARVINEQRRYKRDELAALAASAAMTEIVGGLYIGSLGEQTIEWLPDGSVVVVTAHVPAEIGDWKTHG